MCEAKSYTSVDCLGYTHTFEPIHLQPFEMHMNAIESVYNS